MRTFLTLHLQSKVWNLKKKIHNQKIIRFYLFIKTIIIQTKKVKTNFVCVDFTQSGVIYDEIRSELEELDVAVLINNVGMGYKHPLYFHEFCEMHPNDKGIHDLIACNCIAMTKMTAMVLPKMVKKQKGVIVNVSSISGRVPTPLLAVYSATKAYVNFFSRLINQWFNHDTLFM